MLTVQNDEDDSDTHTHTAPSTRRSAAADAEAEFGSRCRRSSYKLHTSIDEVVRAQAADAESAVVPVAVLREWMETARAVNVDVGRYARAAVERVDRLHVEMALMRSSMVLDVLDREGVHTHTLEQLAKVGSDGAGGSGGGAGGSGGSGATDAVARAMRVVGQLHAGTSALTTDAPMSYFGADVCMDGTPSAAAEGEGVG